MLGGRTLGKPSRRGRETAQLPVHYVGDTGPLRFLYNHKKEQYKETFSTLGLGWGDVRVRDGEELEGRKCPHMQPGKELGNRGLLEVKEATCSSAPKLESGEWGWMWEWVGAVSGNCRSGLISSSGILLSLVNWPFLFSPSISLPFSLQPNPRLDKKKNNNP